MFDNRHCVPPKHIALCSRAHFIRGPLQIAGEQGNLHAAGLSAQRRRGESFHDVTMSVAGARRILSRDKNDLRMST